MKKSLTFAALLVNSWSVVSSWQPAAAFVAPSRRHRHTTLAAAKSSTDPEEYLSKLWDEEKLIERDIVVQEIIEGKNEEDVTKHLVTEMLETALEHVKLLEKVKAKHAKEAHDMFEHAAQKERVLHEFIEEDEELPPIHMDDFVSSRLHQAETEELQAMKKEDESVREYQELRENEENIKDLLEQMRNLEP